MTRRRTANWPPLPAQAHNALQQPATAPQSAVEPFDEATERTNPNAWRNDRFDNRTGAWVPVKEDSHD